MIESIKKIVQQLLTESDNVTHDVFRWLAVVCVVAGISLQVYSVVRQGEKFDMQAFGTGTGILLAGVGAALALKKDN